MRFAIVLSLATLVVPAACHAEWTSTGETPSGGQSFVDLPSRARSGERARMRVMVSYTIPKWASDGSRYLSSVAEQEYDCIRRRVRLLERHDYEGWFVSGIVRTRVVDPDDWSDTPERGLGGGPMLLACERFSLVDSPTLDWSIQPRVGDGADGFVWRYDASRSRRDGSTLTLRWLNDGPALMDSDKSAQVETHIDCAQGRVVWNAAILYSERGARGPVQQLVLPSTSEHALSEILPRPLSALAVQLCGAGVGESK